MNLQKLFKDIEEKYEPENAALGYEDLPSSSDKVAEYGEPYDS